MKVFTKNFGLFTIAAFGLTVLFRFALSYSLDHSSGWAVALVAVVYGLLMGVSGYHFGKRDYLENQIFDIGFRYSLMTYLICNGFGLLWFYLGTNSAKESIKAVGYTALFWGIGIVIHFIFFLATRKHAIKGYGKDEIFE